MKINSVLLAGAGSIGLPTAETIYRADPHCISILAKGERLERYKKTGLWANGERLDFRFTSGEIVDLIIVACKFHHLDQIIEDIAPSVGKDTIILSILNGISSEEKIGRKFGQERLPLAMLLGTDAHCSDGHVKYDLKGTIHFGDANGKNAEREEKLVEFFTRTGVAFKLEQNMKRAQWFKYMFNVGLNQTTAILRLSYGAVQNKGGNDEIPEARQLVEKAMREVITIANAEGIDLNDGDIESVYQTLNRFNPAATSSMCQDVLAGRKTELEMFCLTIMELGKKHNIPVPVNEMYYLQLRIIENINKKES